MGKKKRPEGTPVFSVTLDDCDIQTFSAGGPGGQHQNTSNTGVRIVHRASGAAGTSREERSQLQNKKKAFARMVAHPKFQAWIQVQLHGRRVSAEERVAEDLNPRHLLVMVQHQGQWVLEGRTSRVTPEDF